MRSTLIPALCLLACGLAASPANAQTPAAPQSILVLDASGSMWGQIEGQPKIAIARQAVGAMLDGWNGGDLGLMVYGHRRKGDCEDIELLIEPTGFNAAAIHQQANTLNPKGMTPISAAVRQAAEHLRFTEHQATVILVSDGEETCNADPCALGKELEGMGVDFTAHVIGFDIESGSKAQQQLQCLATNTGGRYLAAKDAGELNRALQTIAQAPSQPEIRFNDGCVAYDQENFTGNQMQMGGSADSRVREVPEPWRQGIKSLACKPGCGILVFTEPGYDGENYSIPDGSQFPRMPADYARPFGSFDMGCSAIMESEASSNVRAKEGEPWIPGAALEVDNDVTLNPEAHAALENRDFTTDQTAEDCRALCDADANCAGWHYEPTGSYFVDHPRCHLKNGAFAVRLRTQGEGWVAGIKPGVKLILDEQPTE